MKPTNFQTFLIYRYRYLAGYTFLLGLGAWMLLYRLGSLVPGLSELELAYANHTSRLQSLIEEPTQPVHGVLSFLSQHFLGANEWAVRLPSIVLAALASICFYFFLSSVNTRRMAIIGALLLTTSSWYLAYARLGFSTINTIFMTAIVLLAAQRALSTYRLVWWLALSFAVGLSLLTPGFVYVLLAALVTNAFVIRDIPHHIKRRVLLWSGLIAGLTLIAAGFAAVKKLDFVRELLLIPDSVPSLLTFLKQAGTVLQDIFWRYKADPVFGLHDVPLLDIFTTLMVVFGAYNFIHDWKSRRTRIVVIAPLVLLFVISFNPLPQHLVLLLPWVYWLAAVGTTRLLNQWYETFPENPVARVVGLVPFIVLLFFVLNNHYQRYFVAWANNPETRASFQQNYRPVREYLSSRPGTALAVVPAALYETLLFATRSLDNVTVSTAVDEPAILSHDHYLITPELENGITEPTRLYLAKQDKQSINAAGSEPIFINAYHLTVAP